MANLRFQENYYSFRNTESVIGAIGHPQSPDQTALAAIEAKLVEANNAFHQQRYQYAISSYQGAERLIYGHLDPVSGGGSPPNSGLWGAPAFLDPLWGAGGGWRNVLPAREPMAFVRPRVPVKPELLGKMVDFSQTGLASGHISKNPEMNTAGDWQLARTYTERGNPKAAAFFRGRAQKTDPATVDILDKAVEGAPPAPSDLRAGHADITVQRITGGVVGVRTAPIPGPATLDRSLGAVVGGKLRSFSWSAGDAPPLDKIRSAIYEARVSLTSLIDLFNSPAEPSDVALDLPHDYYYVIPLGLAECYQALGDFAAAEGHYFEAAAYPFLNTAIEAPYLWQRLATLYLDWGNSLFRNDEAADALPIYVRVLTPDGTVPGSELYTTAALKPGADAARQVIDFLAPLIDNKISIDSLGVNPVVAALIVEVHHQLLKIAGGLDFWGNSDSTVPIWTFEYLQEVAVTFTQLAITAERDLINFQDRTDQATLTHQQLSQAVAQSNAEQFTAQMQALAAAAEVGIYGAAAALAVQRSVDNQALAQEYADNSVTSSLDQNVAAVQGGADADSVGLQDSIQKIGTQFEIDSLNDRATEMGLAAVQAQNEVVAAAARSSAPQAASAAARLRHQATVNDLAALDAQTFTPDVWRRMATAMENLYQRYLSMAVRAAHLMEKAYNFETDQSLHWIKDDYSTGEVKGLLGADALMADIQGLTYDLITSTNGKPQPLRHTISLAERYGLAFEQQFRRHGVMEFETNIEDFDAYYPGTYAGRIEAIEVDVDGIVPVRGISGTLTNSGISGYRVPASRRSETSTDTLKFRVQPRETLVLSDYASRQDSLVIRDNPRLLSIFQGAGLVSTGRIEIPKAINDIDFNTLIDVRLTFYYNARFDPDLNTRVLAQLASRP